MQKTLRTTQNLFNNWGKSSQAVRKQFFFLCEVVASKVWCYIRTTITCKNRHHVLRGLAHGGEQNFRKIVMIKKSTTWRCVAVSGKNVNQRKFFQHQLCSFSPGDGHLQINGILSFLLNTWRQIKFQRNRNDKKIPTTWRMVGLSGLNVNEPKLSSVLTLRVESKKRKCEIRWFKLCSSKLTITTLTRSELSVISKGTLSCSSPRTFGFQNGVEGDWADVL